MFRPFPDLSFHCVTFEPDKTIDVVSAPSSHSAKLGVVVGEIGSPTENTKEFMFDIEFPLISTFLTAAYVAHDTASPLPPPLPAGPAGPVGPVGPADVGCD